MHCCMCGDKGCMVVTTHTQGGPNLAYYSFGNIAFRNVLKVGF